MVNKISRANLLKREVNLIFSDVGFQLLVIYQRDEIVQMQK